MDSVQSHPGAVSVDLGITTTSVPTTQEEVKGSTTKGHDSAAQGNSGTVPPSNNAESLDTAKQIGDSSAGIEAANASEIHETEPKLMLGTEDPEPPATNDSTSVADQQSDADSAEQQDDLDGTPRIIKIPTLFCPRTGYSHGTLMAFGIGDCPRCGQIFTVPPPPKFRPREVVPDDEAPSEAEDTSKKWPIVHRVAYYDIEEQFITKTKWPEPFDLAKARESSEVNDSAFEVLTVLSTSIPKPRYNSWEDPEIKRVLAEGVLNNSDISVSIKTTELHIRSIPLIKAIAKVESRDISKSLGSQRKLIYSDPFQFLAHHLDDLKSLHAGPNLDDLDEPEMSRSHLGTLLDFLKEAYGDIIDEEKRRHQRGVCTFRMLWLLYKPGTTVYMEADGKYSAYVVDEVTIDGSILNITPGDTVAPCTLVLWNLGFDGRYVGRWEQPITIGEFDGEREITSLKVFPSEYIDSKDDGLTRRQLEARGKRWYSLLPGKQVYYSGDLLPGVNFDRPYQHPMGAPPPPPPPPGPRPQPAIRINSRAKHNFAVKPVRQTNGGIPKSFHGRIYVDPAAYYLSTRSLVPRIGQVGDMGEGLAMCPCEVCQGQRAHPQPDFRWARYDVLDPVKEQDLTLEGSPEGPMHRYLLCNWEIPGFILKSRTWEIFDVTSCQEHKRDLGAMDKLVMIAERKEMIKALVHNFSTNPSDPVHKGWAADFIENKGEGRVFLLHGSPGVGKSYTAECIAEYTDRALLSVTCADIGNDEVAMENRLSEWFRLAERWGAVMLIDEADVYLERRSKNDLHRNSLVSVFLRCIEYYRGILFLTTNRVGNFDDAFVSRIHVVLSYEDLGEQQRKEIWKQFFEKLCDDREDFTVTKRARSYILGDDEDAVCKLEWNGREIRNVFQTAVALAEYRFLQKKERSEDDSATLDRKDFEQVCQMTRQFKQYLTKVHGAEENERAYMQKSRALREEE